MKALEWFVLVVGMSLSFAVACGDDDGDSGGGDGDSDSDSDSDSDTGRDTDTEPDTAADGGDATPGGLSGGAFCSVTAVGASASYSPWAILAFLLVAVRQVRSRKGGER